MKQTKKWVSVLTAAAMLCTGIGAVKTVTPIQASAADSVSYTHLTLPTIA